MQTQQQFQDGQLIYLSPAQLMDFSLGGNIRRKRKNAESVKADIQKNGIIQPVVVRPNPISPDTVELLAGYGRRQFAQELNLERVPALVRDVDDQQALEIHLAENTQREDITLADEVEFAKRYISFHNGDRKSAALALGWTLSKLNERLELRTCNEAVLEALDNATIKAGHALILSSFNDNVQTNTLEKLLKEKWTVAELKVRANKVQIPLSVAKFDTAECQGCAHNSQRQAGLFDMDSTVEAKCANNQCFKAKSQSYLTQAKADAEERFGKVILLSESNAADRNTVSSDVVGEDQFEGGCKPCASRIVVMNDSLTGASGDVIENQCIDTACFATCQKAFADAKQKAKAEAAKQPIQDTVDTASSPSQTDTPSSEPVDAMSAKPVAKAKLSQPAMDLHKAELRSAAGQQLKGNKTFALALQVLAMMQYTGFKVVTNSNAAVAKLMHKSESELHAMLDAIMVHVENDASGFGSYESNASAFLTAAAMQTEGGEDALIKAWNPQEDLLNKYTTEQLIFMCEQSGFAETMEDAKTGAFTKAKKGKKSELVKLMLTFSMDWSTYAPDAYRDLMASAAK